MCRFGEFKVTLKWTISQLIHDLLFFFVMICSYTKAPEVLDGDYTASSDCWSLGVIIYMLLSSQIPFYAKRSKNMVSQIKNARYSLEGPAWENISNGAKHLVANLLQVNAEKRLTAQQSLEHLWIRKNIEHTDMTPPDDSMLKAVDDSLQQYRHTSILKKLALNVSSEHEPVAILHDSLLPFYLALLIYAQIIAHKSTTQEIIALRKVFDSIDKSHNGTVDYGEFKEGLKRSRFSAEELEQIFESIVSFASVLEPCFDQGL